jgi:hypothetical protein
MLKAEMQTITTPRRRPPRITERQHREIANRVTAAVAVRDELRERSAARRKLERQYRPLRRVAGKVATLAIVASLTGIVVSHALAGG